ncbi:MAG TPA: TonB family protein [Steroidobacteraceae bacterium]|jgi:protein TonB
MLNSITESFGLSRRAFIVGSILVIHTFIVYALATGLGKALMTVAPPTIVGNVLFEPRTPVQKPPLPPVNFEPPKISRVERVVDITDKPQEENTVAVDNRPLPVIQDLVTPPPHVPPPVRMVGQNSLPNTEDFYPPDLRRQGIEGAANVRVCVDAKGVRQGEPTVELSSGNPRLDEGALKIARAGKYARAIQGDMPVGTCHRFHIAFHMK